MDIFLELPPLKKISNIAVCVVVMASAGMFIGFMGVTAFLVIAAPAALIFMLFQRPALIVAVWLFLAPPLQGRNISLGAGIPDITVDRVIFVLVLLTLILRLSTRQVRLRKFKMEDYLLSIFLLFGFLSIVFLINVNVTRQLYFWFDSYFIPIVTSYIILHIFNSEKDLKIVIYFVIVALFVQTFYTPIEYLTGRNLFGVNSQFIQGTIRVNSFTNSAWTLGAFVGMYLPFAIYVGNLKSAVFSKKWRFFALIAAIFGVLCIFLTFMRAAWLSIFALMLFLAWGNRKLLKYAGVILFLGLIFSALYPIISQSTIWQERIIGQDTTTARVILAEMQLKIFQDSPIIGHGIATLPKTFYIKSVSNGFGGEYDVFMPSHNNYATIMLEYGFFGILYFGAIFKIILSGFKSYRIGSSRFFLGKELIGALLGSGLVFMIQAVTFETRFFSSITLFYWIILALIRVTTDKITEAENRARIM